MYVNGRIGHRLSRVLSSSAKHWLKDAVEKTKIWKEETGWETCYNKTIVYAWFYFPDHRRRDTHNTLKILLDALQDGGIYDDDKYALPRIMDYTVDKSQPRVELEFKIFSDEEKLNESK
jgi:crossover junction endodeoxyribonuclease RusA